MFFTEEKLNKRLAQLEPLRYRDTFPVAEYEAREDAAGNNGVYPQQADASTAYTMKKGDTWTGRDRYLWLSACISIPAEWADRTVIGLFDFGHTEEGNNVGFEALAYVNGHPFQGVDSNHIEMMLPAAYTGEARLDFRLWSGLEGGGAPRAASHTIRDSRVGWLDHAVDRLYYTSKAILQTIAILPASAYEKTLLTKLLNQALLKLDWALPGADAFYASAQVADMYLNDELDKVKTEHPVLVTTVGHTHIDVAWLWRLKHTREKAARSFSTVLRLMEHDPDYIFLQTQPQLYDYIKQDYPELYERIKQRIAEGRWEAGGGMWVEADCNLTSGESLVRQFLLGTRFFQTEFGVNSRYLWLPDVFGYSWALPQILRKSGFDTFMTTKISWNQFNRMPRDTFRWRGMDGSEVLTHFITTPDDWEGGNAFYYTYNGHVKADTVQGVWSSYQDKETNQNLLISYGYGDGGGGVTREMLELRRQLDRIPGIPAVKSGRADDYFVRLQQTFQQTDSYVHTWDGELYLEYHRGTYTSQAYNKLLNRRLELLYRETEWLHILRAAATGDWAGYPASRLEDGWKIILRNQFHDIIPGSSIAEVYEDSTLEYAEAEAIGRNAWETATAATLPIAALSASLRSNADALAAEAPMNEPAKNGQTTHDDHLPVAALIDRHVDQNAPAAVVPSSSGELTVLNSSSWSLHPLLHIPFAQCGQGDYVWSDRAGERLSAQQTTDGWLVQANAVPSLGFGTICYTSAETVKTLNDADATIDLAAADAFFRYEDGKLITPHYELEWNASGQLTRVTDLQYEREVLAAGERGNVLQLFEDKPMNFDAWDIDIFYQDRMDEITTLSSVRLAESGSLRAVVEFVWNYDETQIVQQLIVYTASRRIDFVTDVDWKERQKLLKVAFPVQIRATEATYDIQFGNVKRPTHWNTSWDWARFESVGHQWADLSERSYGVSLLNDCKYGYDIKDHTLRLSLLKSAIHPDPMADYGQHQFTYSLYPHSGDWLDGGTVQEAWQLNAPCTTIPAGTLAHTALAASTQMVTDSSLDGYGVTVVNPAADGQNSGVNAASATTDHAMRAANQATAETVANAYVQMPDHTAETTANSAFKLEHPFHIADRVDKATADPSTHAATLASFSLFRFSADHVLADAIKKAEDSNRIVLRIHEYGGMRTHLTIASDLAIESWQECNLMEQPIGETEYGNIELTITPYELRTFLITVKEG
ncbi:alpha-mannosidase [Paenibacillus campi]|uniref:alpha-mannosidase n=1 Tax=Paenibacillus campi TaxID=3106031 RepID=UPI002AFDF2D3|nr:alpha-mannosidase [Paenibacillus sp. SGZ-1009]